MLNITLLGLILLIVSVILVCLILVFMNIIKIPHPQHPPMTKHHHQK